jgi:hypothetical protein
MPKLLDPLTGHEAIGSFADEFRTIIEEAIYDKYRDMIDEYNQIMSYHSGSIESWIKDQALSKKIERHVLENFRPIEIGK